MDSDALYLVKQLFWQGSYKAAIQEASQADLSDLSNPESLSRALYIARSHLAISPPSTSSAVSVIQPALDTDEPPASARAVKSFAEFLESTEDDKEAKLEELRDLTLEYEGEEVDEETREEERVVRCLAATAFILQGENEEAVTTLTEGVGKTDLECTGLLVQLLLSLDRRDLAQTTYQAAKKWGEDSLMIQMMEAWIGMKTGGRPLHQSYYLYEELYQMPAGRTANVIAGHAAAHYLLGHVDEAKSDIMDALKREDAKNDSQVLAVAASMGMNEQLEHLETTAPLHPLVLDLEAKTLAFDEAAAKFAVTV